MTRLDAEECQDRIRALERDLAAATKLVEKLRRERDLAETRGHRWLADAVRMDEALGALIEHIDAETDAGRAGKQLYIYRHLRQKLFEARIA